MAVLILQNQGHTDERILLDAVSIKVGRDETNEIVIDDRTISREHALITWRHPGHRINDLGSRNGTWVGDTRIGSEPRELQDGDVIRLGRQASAIFLSEDSTMSDTIGDERAFRGYGSTVFGQIAEGSRQLRFLKMTPWLRMAAAVLGVMAGALSLLWWSLKIFVS